MAKYAVRVYQEIWGTRFVEAADEDAAEEMVRELMDEENRYGFCLACRDGEIETDITVEEVEG